MDIDAELGGLKKFRREAEEAITFFHGLKLAGFNPAAFQAGQTTVGDGTKPVTVDDLSSLADRLTIVEANKGADEAMIGHIADQQAVLDSRVAALEGSKAEAEQFSDRLNAMLAWFEAKHEGLEVLLSLDGVPDDKPAEAPADVHVDAETTDKPLAHLAEVEQALPDPAPEAPVEAELTEG